MAENQWPLLLGVMGPYPSNCYMAPPCKTYGQFSSSDANVDTKWYLPLKKRQTPPENRPKRPKRKPSSSNYQFSGLNSRMKASGSVVKKMIIFSRKTPWCWVPPFKEAPICLTKLSETRPLPFKDWIQLCNLLVTLWKA